MKIHILQNFKKSSLAVSMMLVVVIGNGQIQKGKDIEVEAVGDQSGISVSMPNPNTVAIGAYLNDGNGTDAGQVRIYSWNGIAWIQKGLDIDGEAAGDKLGISVSMPDANSVAIGAYENDGSGNNSGHVRLYSWNGSSWIKSIADIDGEMAGDRSGVSVSMPDPNIVAIGANQNSGSGKTYSGHVRVYSSNYVGIIESGIIGGLKAYPNPSNEILNIDLGINNHDFLVIVKDVIGREIDRKAFSGLRLIQINMPVKAGIYLIELNDNENKAILKVIRN